MTPQFHVGQTVFLRPSAPRNAAAGADEIRAMLPDEGGQRRYRIKSLIEPHERVALEQELSAAMVTGVISVGENQSPPPGARVP